MAKYLYFALLAVVVWQAHADRDVKDQDFIPGSTQNKREIKCGKYYAQYPNPEDCSSYIVCQNGQKSIKSCPSGQHYDFRTIRCVEPCDAYCNKTLSCECKWSTCGLDDVCFLEQIVGGCRNRVPRYFFDKRSGQCERFGYSGCMGNENNYETLEECQQKCSKSLDDLCFLPPDVGPCRAGFYNYYFNRQTGQCEKFLYGGCQGNKNNFRNKEDCEKACIKSEDKSPEPSSEESFELHVDGFPDPPAEVLDPSFECESDGLYPHPKNCRSFVKCSKGVPTLKTCPLKLHFNNETKKCATPCKANCDRTYACKCNWPTCGTNALCFLPAKPGPCNGKFERFHFNKRSGECTTFEYGGCLGNENNFLTKHACERKCKHSLDICKLPYKTGNCKGKFVRYYFNHNENKCQKFTYGGCNKNHNNFKTLEECETTCLQNKHQEAYPLLSCPENDSWGNRDDCSSYYKCSGRETHLMKCPSGQHFNHALKRCTAPCDAFCEPSLACKCGWPNCKKSEDFTCVRDGLFKHPESCNSYIHCIEGQKYEMPCPKGYHYNENTKFCENPSKAQCKESKAYSEDICRLPAETGPCKGSISKYYFDHEEGNCKKFTYGGCGGNSNNFESIEECERSCLRSTTYSEDICRLPAETGPCQGLFSKYYFDHEEGNCKKFTYGGCGGNSNNFESIEECERSCSRSTKDDNSEPICTEDGLRSDFESCNRYIQCSNGQRKILTCIPGLHFNEATKQCDSPCDARCDMSLAMECGWPVASEPTSDSHCPENEHLSLSGAACQRNCTNYKDWIVPCPIMWRPGCVCDNGYVRSSEGKCIPTDECVNEIEHSDAIDISRDNHCPENEHLSLSGAACQRNCTNYKDWIVPCPIIWRPGCVCDSGYVRSSEGKCIPTDECENEREHSDAIGFQCPTPDGEFEYPGNDRKYIKCTNNISTVEQCRGYQMFDVIKKKCVYN